MATWAELEQADADLAGAIERRFGANRHHIVGTVRSDGSPRLSGTEVDIGNGEVGLGMMLGSQKLADVGRDSRVEIHSAPLEDDLATGDAKLAGRLHRTGVVGDDEGFLFALDIARVSLVRVDGEELEIKVWTPSGGSRTIRRR